MLVNILRNLFCGVCVFVLYALPADSQESVATARGETIFVPAYPEVVTPQGRREELQVTLIVHNADPLEQIIIRSVRYHDATGIEVSAFQGLPTPVRPLASRDFLLNTSRSAAAIGGGFVVDWESADPARSPVVETLMIGGGGTQGISFTSRGRVISRR